MLLEAVSPPLSFLLPSEHLRSSTRLQLAFLRVTTDAWPAAAPRARSRTFPIRNVGISSLPSGWTDPGTLTELEQGALLLMSQQGQGTRYCDWPRMGPAAPFGGSSHSKHRVVVWGRAFAESKGARRCNYRKREAEQRRRSAGITEYSVDGKRLVNTRYRSLFDVVLLWIHLPGSGVQRTY